MRTGPRYEKPLRPGSPALGPGSPVHHCEPPARHASISARRSGTLVGRSSSLAQFSGALARRPIMALWYSGPSLYTQALALQPSGPTLKASWAGTPAVWGGSPALLQSSTQALQPSTLALWPSTLALRVRHSHTPAGTPASSGGQAQVQEASTPKGTLWNRGGPKNASIFWTQKWATKGEGALCTFAFCGPVLGPENGRKKRAVFLWHLWLQGVAVGFFQVPTNVTGAACMDASEPKGHRLNLSETI